MPLYTQLCAHSSTFAELLRAVLQAAFVQSRITVRTHALSCAFILDGELSSAVAIFHLSANSNIQGSCTSRKHTKTKYFYDLGILQNIIYYIRFYNI